MRIDGISRADQLEHTNELRQRLLRLLLEIYGRLAGLSRMHAFQQIEVIDGMCQRADRRRHSVQSRWGAAEAQNRGREVHASPNVRREREG